MTPAPNRPFPFRVRPQRLETDTSLTRRVLAANGEPEALVSRLLTTAGATRAQWMEMLHQKNRTTPHPAHPHLPVHKDGSSCVQCTDLLPARALCMLCARGEHLEQVPHFGSPVCVHHNRWTGLLDPCKQSTVGAEHREASVLFTKLVRKRLLDVRLYRLLSHTLVADHAASERDAFPAVTRIVRATTDFAFQRALLDPTIPFAAARTLLDATVAEAAGAASPLTAQVLWMLLRPAFATARGTVISPASSHPHDFPIHPAVLAQVAGVGPCEPFAHYPYGHPETVAVASRLLAVTHARIDPNTRQHHLVCAHGHQYLGSSAKSRCTLCPPGALAEPGVDDLASVAPHLVSEWDTDANGALTPLMVTARSARRVAWRCAKGHPFKATPNNRTSNDQGCPVCQNRVIIAGVNDFATRYPRQFAELAPEPRSRYNPQRHTPTSDRPVDWVCADGHTFRATFRERASGRNCPQCRRLRSVATRGSLATTHPDIAAEWVVTGNGRTANDYSAGSRYPATWRCANGHEYSARIERRVGGTSCPYCANRMLMPGFNDLASTQPLLAQEWHPYRNRERADEVFAGATALRWWRCRYGHETRQSAPHRALSRGCTSCAPGERILATGARAQAAHAPLEHPATGDADSLAAPTTVDRRFDAPAETALDEEEMTEAIRETFAPRGFANDSIVEAWSEVAGFAPGHHDPAPILRAILARTPAIAAHSLPSALDLADTVLDLYAIVDGTSLPPAARLIATTLAALRVIQECDGPFTDEDAFRRVLRERTTTHECAGT